MKHNEIKAFFKKRLNDELKDYVVLSVDETASSRNLYILDKHSLDTLMLVRCWFATSDYSISVFKIISEIKDTNKKINYFKDQLFEIKGSYINLAPIGDLMFKIKNELEQDEIVLEVL